MTDRAGNTGTSDTVNVTVTSATSWSMAAPGADGRPPTGDALDQLGDVRSSVPLDLDQGGGTLSSAVPRAASCSADMQRRWTSTRTASPSSQSSRRPSRAPTTPACRPRVSAVLTWNGTAGATLTYSTSGLHPGDPLVIAAQVPSAVTTTGPTRGACWW